MLKDRDFLKIADLIAENSHSKRNQVGCVITLKKRIISTGYNGTFPGRSNVCENENNITLDEVIHAEANAILFALKHFNDLSECTLYVNLSPCIHCAKLILLSGIRRVIFKEKYRDTYPMEFLKEEGVDVLQETYIR